MHSASLMKLPVMAALFSSENEGSITLSSLVRPKNTFESHIAGKTFSVENTLEDRQYSLFELTEKMIVNSDNQATCILMENLPLSRINREAYQWGMKKTKILRKVMDIPAHEKGIDNLTTASDVCSFYRKLLSGEGITEYARKTMIDFLVSAKHLGRIPVSITNKWQTAHKTGTVTGKVYESGIVFSEPPTIFAVMVCNKNMSGGETAIKDILESFFLE
ncbi:serine hydrolase [candidate division WOR-3 bacterium]|nr:serine hydrolase [candidate division WOR-3 bacterium]